MRYRRDLSCGRSHLRPRFPLLRTGEPVTTHALMVLLVAVALTEIAAIATSIDLHRALAHRALRVHPTLDVFFRAVLWMTTGQNRREWVAVHRKHHTFTDKAGDPHSPRLLGFWRVQILNVYYDMRHGPPNPRTLGAPGQAVALLDIPTRSYPSRGAPGKARQTGQSRVFLGPAGNH